MRGYSSFIVEARPGAGGRVALDALKGSAADGSVMVLTPEDMIALYPHVYKILAYDALKDFAPVTPVCNTSFLLTVGPKVPAAVKTLADFIAWCRAIPNEASYATGGAGSAPHFTGVMLARAAGFEFVHVPYPGVDGVQDLLAGQIVASIFPITATLAYVQAGSLRAFATTGPKGSPPLPDVPTVREAGYPELEGTGWFGVLVPAKTPANIVEGLNLAIREAVESSSWQAGELRQPLPQCQSTAWEPPGWSPVGNYHGQSKLPTKHDAGCHGLGLPRLLSEHFTITAAFEMSLLLRNPSSVIPADRFQKSV
jgi:tripartite-type tricarboxylate transporter receptor subunit TctC